MPPQMKPMGPIAGILTRDTPASSVASLILEDIDEQKKEECVDTDVVEEEEEDEGSSSILGGILKFFLLIVILVLSTWYMCNINSSLSKIEEACWSNLNSSSFNAETAQILNEEMSEVKNTEWPKFDKSFLFEYVSASVNSVDTAQTLHDVGVKEVQNCSSGGEDVTKTENNGEELVDLIVGGVAASEEIEDPVLELQVGEQERSSPSVNNEDSEDIEVSQTEIADAVAGLSTYKEILKGLSPQSKWVVLKAAVDFSISSLILTALLIVCKIRASNDSSLAKELKPEPVIETKREDLQVTSCTIEEEDDRRLKGSSPNPQANHLIMDDEDRMSSSSRPPSVELLGEFVVKVSSSSLKQRGVKMESGDKNHSVNIEKNHESSSERLSTSLTTRFNAAAGRTTTLKKQKVDGSDSGSGQGMKNEALLTTPVRRSSRIRNKAMQSPSPNFSSKR
ncbi:hypothetical protein SAY87_002429 [Trapa incisa]|uniref:Transmembrane protein n=1 Tax=Trapa incisa TaxID=236973 RepID=A0AAN7PZI3_9MYRT|nr:hypothetical protein SAY87_002429 [Trapa incisa]